MQRYRQTIVSLILLLLTVASGRSEMVVPLKIPLQLSANFGELRSNHFHSGIDLKTQGRTGLPLYAMDEGYVARVVVSPWGFGRAIYINHPSGLTTVYAHMESFAPFIDKVVREKQYEQESFTVDCEFAPNEIPVKRGEEIGKSGNSGSSGGPHLHLDVRDTETQDPLDPQQWFSQITDNVAPEVRRLILYSHNNGIEHNRIERKPQRNASGKYLIADTLNAWGDVSMGVEAYDRMTGTSNIYGVHQVELFVDDSLFFATHIDRYSFDESRYINAFTENGKIMRTYIAPGNRLKSIYRQTSNRGILHIDEERIFRCRYELTDFKGNRTTLSFNLLGKIQEPIAPQKRGQYFSYAVENRYAGDSLSFVIPAGALYDNIDFTHKASPSAKYHSAIHSLSPAEIRLHKSAKVSIAITADTLANKEKYYLVRISEKRISPIIGKYEAGSYTAKIDRLGSYAIAVDTIAPTITPLNLKQWSNGTISLRIKDKESGIKSYRGEIDGKFVLVEWDAKTGRLSYRLEPNRVTRGGKHTLHLSVVDACGNEQIHKQTFTW